MHTSDLHIPQQSFKEYSSSITFRSFMPSKLGFLLTDASLNLLSANQEATEILSYPSQQTSSSITKGFEKQVRSGLRRLLLLQSSEDDGLSPIRFNSGRRTYFCRAFVLEGQRQARDAPRVVAVLERGMSAHYAIYQISGQFHLTRREQQVVTLLLQGLRNKEIAKRLEIKADTVKVFLRSVMIKMGASSRSGIASKVLDLVLEGVNGSVQEGHGKWRMRLHSNQQEADRPTAKRLQPQITRSQRWKKR